MISACLGVLIYYIEHKSAPSQKQICGAVPPLFVIYRNILKTAQRGIHQLIVNPIRSSIMGVMKRYAIIRTKLTR